MEFRIYSKERFKYRVVAIAMLAAFFGYEFWKVLSDGIPKDLLVHLRIMYFLLAFAFLALSFGSALGLILQKPWGVARTFDLVVIWMILFEFNIVVLGPRLIRPGYWICLVLAAIFFVVIGKNDLWESQWVGYADKKSIVPLWLYKKVYLGLGIVLQVVFVVFFVLVGRKTCFFYPAFETHPIGSAEKSRNIVLPFEYQVDLPPGAKVIHVDSAEGSMLLQVGKKTWELESKEIFQNYVVKYFCSTDEIDNFMAERFGVLPKTMKSIFINENPTHYFKIENEDIWGAVAVFADDWKGEKQPNVMVFLWDKGGVPLGAIKASVASLSLDDWKWVYGIRKTKQTGWSAEQYDDLAKKFLANHQTDLAGFCYASAVLKSRDKPKNLKKLIEYYEKYDSLGRAKFELHMSLFDYPDNVILKSIKLKTNDPKPAEALKNSGP